MIATDRRWEKLACLLALGDRLRHRGERVRKHPKRVWKYKSKRKGKV